MKTSEACILCKSTFDRTINHLLWQLDVHSKLLVLVHADTSSSGGRLPMVTSWTLTATASTMLSLEPTTLPCQPQKSPNTTHSSSSMWCVLCLQLLLLTSLVLPPHLD